ncbi:MAG: GspH/FimT family pseudopilin [Gammaproteobacteria bacterium]
MNLYSLKPSVFLCKSSMVRKKFNSGFTMVELLVALAVSAIAVSLALPNFKNMVSNNRIVSQINNFNGAIALARSEAIKRGRGVTIIPINPANWANGWNIVLPSNANQILSHVDAFSGNTVLATNVATPVLQFSDDGRINTINNIQFTLCNSVRVNIDDKAGKALTVTPTGVTYLDSNFVCP